tara:strand:- start:287 stop:565 length:279 start_codon:yes stop_codon:yes gene_type:complete
MHLEAKTIDPKARKSRVTCSECGLSYSARNYNILYDNEKLAFFKLKPPKGRSKIICHGCLNTVAYKLMGVLKEIKLKIYNLADEIVTVVFKK